MESSKLNCFFFLPGFSEKFRTGGRLVIQDIAQFLADHPAYNVRMVTTHERHPGALTQEEAFSLAKEREGKSIFIITWGPLVENYIRQLRRYAPQIPILYYAQSFGWPITVPSDIPVVCASRFVMAQWAVKSPKNPYHHIPPPLDPVFRVHRGERDIDVLIHKRKQNDYCLNELLPALQKRKLNIYVIEDWISREVFADLLNRTKIFLYITALHKIGWFRKSLPEGFGLPALEAAVCGALVGSNLLGGVTDFLIPGENCIKLHYQAISLDVASIEEAIKNFSCNEGAANRLREDYAAPRIMEQWHKVLGIC